MRRYCKKSFLLEGTEAMPTPREEMTSLRVGIRGDQKRIGEDSGGL
jgi:hypothetical protein